MDVEYIGAANAYLFTKCKYINFVYARSTYLSMEDPIRSSRDFTL